MQLEVVIGKSKLLTLNFHDHWNYPLWEVRTFYWICIVFWYTGRNKFLWSHFVINNKSIWRPTHVLQRSIWLLFRAIFWWFVKCMHMSFYNMHIHLKNSSSHYPIIMFEFAAACWFSIECDFFLYHKQWLISVCIAGKYFNFISLIILYHHLYLLYSYLLLIYISLFFLILK